MSATITLDDKVAIITGASRGIGEAVARTFAAHGAKVVLASRKLDGVAAVAGSIGQNAHAVATHTGKQDSPTRSPEARSIWRPTLPVT